MPARHGAHPGALFVLVSRKKAITQVIGFLMRRTAWTLLAVLGTYGIPLIVELGVFLAAPRVLVMQIFVYQIQRDLREHGRRAPEPVRH